MHCDHLGTWDCALKKNRNSRSHFILRAHASKRVPFQPWTFYIHPRPTPQWRKQSDLQIKYVEIEMKITRKCSRFWLTHTIAVVQAPFEFKFKCIFSDFWRLTISKPDIRLLETQIYLIVDYCVHICLLFFWHYGDLKCSTDALSLNRTTDQEKPIELHSFARGVLEIVWKIPNCIMCHKHWTIIFMHWPRERGMLQNKHK